MFKSSFNFLGAAMKSQKQRKNEAPGLNYMVKNDWQITVQFPQLDVY